MILQVKATKFQHLDISSVSIFLFSIKLQYFAIIEATFSESKIFWFADFTICSSVLIINNSKLLDSLFLKLKKFSLLYNMYDGFPTSFQLFEGISFYLILLF